MAGGAGWSVGGWGLEALRKTAYIVLDGYGTRIMDAKFPRVPESYLGANGSNDGSATGRPFMVYIKSEGQVSP